MGLLLSEAQKIQFSALQTDLLQELVTMDQLYSVVDFQDISPLTRNQYTREATIPSALYIGTTGTVTQTQWTGTQKNDDIKLNFVAVQIPKTQVRDGNVLAATLKTGLKAINRAFGGVAITGVGDAFEPAGLSSLVTLAQTVTANKGSATAATLSMSAMDEAFFKVIPSQPSFIVCNDAQLIAYKQLLRAAGGTDAAMMQLENFSTPVLTFNGVPILRSNWITSTEPYGTGGAQHSSMYFVYSNSMDGFGGFYSGPSLIEVEGPISTAGSDSWTYNIAMRAGLSLKSTLACSVIRGLK
jgi:hypothetical protein